MEIEKLLQLIDKVSNSRIDELSYQEGEISLVLKKSGQEILVRETEMPVIQAGAKEMAAISGNIMKSPLVGTFYHAPAPDAPSFVKVGDTVKKGQILGIIEAMKLMNEIEAEFDGVVEEILAENEAMVEYGQPLFVIR